MGGPPIPRFYGKWADPGHVRPGYRPNLQRQNRNRGILLESPIALRVFRLTLAYDGTAYAGWQVQPGHRTIQQTLEDALRQITSETARTLASGRTDAGVHALGQVVAVRSHSHLAPEVLARALNAVLPADIRVEQAVETAEDFHPIRDAVAKRYRYLIHDGPVREVFARHYCWHFAHGRLDAEAMARAAEPLQGTHDFSSFETSGAPRNSSVRTVADLSVRRARDPWGRGDATEWIVLEIEADGFLYNMVRAIVGTLVEVGRGAQPETWPAEVLAAADRRVAGPTAPPQGLFLVRVDYPPEK